MSERATGSTAKVCYKTDDTPTNSGNISMARNGTNYWNFRLQSGVNMGFATISTNVAHTHNMNHIHSITSDGGNENRPDNYTINVWKRTA